MERENLLNVNEYLTRNDDKIIAALPEELRESAEVYLNPTTENRAERYNAGQILDGARLVGEEARALTIVKLRGIERSEQLIKELVEPILPGIV